MFDAYGAVVIGYHGTTLTAAKKIVDEKNFTLSTNEHDWLGYGAYFSSSVAVGKT